MTEDATGCPHYEMPLNERDTALLRTQRAALKALNLTPEEVERVMDPLVTFLLTKDEP